ncbi:MAG: ScyD/ScyE family protein [Ilumatobacteraceae bacterium]
MGTTHAMHNLRRLLATVGAVSVVALGALPSAASAGSSSPGHGRHDRSSAKVLAEGLNSPKGLAITGDHHLLMGQGAFGPPDPALVYFRYGPNRGSTSPVSDPANLVDVAVSPLDGTGWAIRADLHLIHQLADGTVVDVLDIAAYQAGDPDPTDTEGNPGESNPYGLTIARNGDAVFVDAANNDVVRVTPDGVPTTMARLDVEMVATDHVGDPGLPPELPAEAVPTTVTQGPDGAFYVGELKGFPFRPGSSNIWRIKPWADGATCSAATPDPTHACRLYSSGFTAIQDIAFDRWGRLYVYELAEGGVLAFEAGLPGEDGSPPAADLPPAVLLQVRPHGWGWHRRGDGGCDQGRELARGQLFAPGGIVVDARGSIYVTDGMFGNGRLLKIVD